MVHYNTSSNGDLYPRDIHTVCYHVNMSQFSETNPLSPEHAQLEAHFLKEQLSHEEVRAGLLKLVKDLSRYNDAQLRSILEMSKAPYPARPDITPEVLRSTSDVVQALLDNRGLPYDLESNPEHPFWYKMQSNNADSLRSIDPQRYEALLRIIDANLTLVELIGAEKLNEITALVGPLGKPARLALAQWLVNGAKLGETAPTHNTPPQQ